MSSQREIRKGVVRIVESQDNIYGIDSVVMDDLSETSSLVSVIVGGYVSDLDDGNDNNNMEYVSEVQFDAVSTQLSDSHDDVNGNDVMDDQSESSSLVSVFVGGYLSDIDDETDSIDPANMFEIRSNEIKFYSPDGCDDVGNTDNNETTNMSEIRKITITNQSLDNNGDVDGSSENIVMNDLHVV